MVQQATQRHPEPPLFIVINGSSGRHELDTTLKDIESATQATGRQYSLFVIASTADIDITVRRAVDAATQAGGIVVAVGGDGTINAVATLAMREGCLFGAVPQGTFNYFGRTHGIPEDIEGALDDLLTGQPVPVQAGLVNDRVFLVNASVGFYPELLEDREAFKQRYGRSRFVALWAAIIATFGNHRHLDMTLQQDGKRTMMRTSTLFIGNNRLQLSQVGVQHAASLKQGKLVAIAVRPIGTMQMLWLAARGALGRLGEAENIIEFSFRSLTVAPLGRLRSRQRIKVAFDGEIVWLRAPLEFRVAPQPLMLIKGPRALESAQDKPPPGDSCQDGPDHRCHPPREGDVA